MYVFHSAQDLKTEIIYKKIKQKKMFCRNMAKKIKIK